MPVCVRLRVLTDAAREGIRACVGLSACRSVSLLVGRVSQSVRACVRVCARACVLVSAFESV